MEETNDNGVQTMNEQVETITVVSRGNRRKDARPASPSWFVAKLNPVSRFIGALLLCIPMFLTLDIVSASVAFGSAPGMSAARVRRIFRYASGSVIRSERGKTACQRGRADFPFFAFM